MVRSKFLFNLHFANTLCLRDYRGKSSIFLQDPWPAIRRVGQSCLQPFWDTLDRVFKATGSKSGDEEKGQQNDPIQSDFPPKPSKQSLSAGAKRVFRMPPNIQLNLSSDHFDPTRMHKGGEIFLAATIGFFLQTGLIIIAAVTASRLNSSSSSFLQSSVYGFPCYAAGSLLLCLGTGLCSLIVEHSTDEYS